MALQALSSNDFLNFILYDTISATPCSSHASLETASLLLESLKPQDHDVSVNSSNSLMSEKSCSVGREAVSRRHNLLAVQGKKKRRRKPRVCKNKEEAETQRMTHIAVERNRRKLMNEHLAVLRSLMPESYVQRGDQASIVGGAIEFVKELEHLLQSFEAKKLELQRGLAGPNNSTENANTTLSEFPPAAAPPFAQFFGCPQYTWSQIPSKFTSNTAASIADIEVTLIETHANLRILTRRSPRQLSKLVAGLNTLYLTVLHINLTTMDQLVLYSISAKLEEGCQLTSADDLAGAVHHMLRIIEQEAAPC